MTVPWEPEGQVALVTGVGPGTGAAIARRLAQGGYRVAMLARSEDRLRTIADELPRSLAVPCDVSDEAALSEAVATVRGELGAPRVVVHNAVGGAFGNFMEVEAATLRQNFEVNTMALFHLARLTVQDMIDTGGGALLGTGNTSAYRGKAQFAAFAPTKAAQRILLESIARTVGPMGVHAAYLAIDAVIDVPWTRKRAPDKPDDFFAKPEDIAEEAWRLLHQPRSAWSFDSVIRPFGEVW
jgi:NAD(P)-dependent dehydrogenase (short-subunit alcohol dehydrogenase family)